MPLPSDCALSLLGSSRPGDTVPSKPKQAIIIRLSTEILDALESSPDAIKLDFSESPILWAGSNHFAMKAAKENLHHELYLRAASAAKKNAPLKLHANVVGKFQVERQLDNDVRSRLRKTTKTLQEQRQERGIIQLEAPPAHLTSKTSKKSAAGVKNKQPRLLSNIAKTSSRDPAAYKAKNAIPMSVKRRMIQLLAVHDRTADEIVRSLSRLDLGPSDGIRDLLEQLAEVYTNEAGVNNKSPSLYRLKLKTWAVVRPIEWDWSSEHERSIVSTKFEDALRQMGIPESDPLWKHSLLRGGKDNLSSLPATTKQSVPTPRVASGSSKKETVSQRALATVGTKDKRVKSGKVDPNNEATISKDGTVHAGRSLSVHGKIQAHETLPLPPAPKAVAPLRKPPGSGFRSGKASTPTTSPPATENPVRGHRDGGSKNRDPPSLLQGQSVGSTATVGRQLDPNAAARRTHNIDADTGRSHSRSKKISESMGKGGTDNRVVESEGAVQKRKTITRDLEGNDGDSTQEPIPKKRKVDRNLVDDPYPPSNENGPGGRVSKKIVKKLEPSVRHKSKDDPVPTSRHQTKASSPSSSLLHDNFSSGQNANTKPVASSRRRRSPIYTSSDDDNESTQTSKDITSQQALPTDHASLRRRYNKSYGEYLTAFHKLVTVRDKMEGILGTRDANNANSVSESDVDMELMDHEELRRLWSRHKRLRDELESIQQSFSQNNGRVIAM